MARPGGGGGTALLDKRRKGGAVQKSSAPFGVIDIGSNSVRLVIYSGIRRVPEALFNEKVLCGIGRNLASTGELDVAGMMSAYQALARFRAIAMGLGVGRIEAVATAAVREAANGAAFVKAAEQELGAPIRIISGADEGFLSAEGVLSGIPDAKGVVGDLGGGSLELCPVSAGTAGKAATLPLGPFRLLDESGAQPRTASEIAAAALQKLDWLGAYEGQRLYAVGGAWRNFARLHMARSRYPLHILHHYTIDRAEAEAFAGFISGQSRRSLERIAAVPRRRIELMPYASAVLEAVLKALKPQEVVISAYGLREGLLFGKLSKADRVRDPLLEAARDQAGREGRTTVFLDELDAWIAPLFAGEEPGDRRLRKVAAILSDIGWRDHPDYRGEQAFLEILRAPFAGITHHERLKLALAVYHRYAGDEEPPGLQRMKRLLSPSSLGWARSVGLSLRLGYALTAGGPGLLPKIGLTVEERRVILRAPDGRTELFGDRARKYLGAVAKTLALEHQTL